MTKGLTGLASHNSNTDESTFHRKIYYGLIYFDELGRRLETNTLVKQEKSYVLIGIVEKNSDLKKNETLIDDEDLTLATKMWVNEIKTDGSFHFDTTGKIFGLGFGPKYCIDDKQVFL